MREWNWREREGMEDETGFFGKSLRERLNVVPVWADFFQLPWYWLLSVSDVDFSHFTFRPQEKNKDKDKRFRPLYDIPYMFEAREFMRKKLIGKKVRFHLNASVMPAFLHVRCYCSAFSPNVIFLISQYFKSQLYYFHEFFCILCGVTEHNDRADLELNSFSPASHE